MLAQGEPLSEVTGELARRFGVQARLLPMTDDPVATRVIAVREEDGQSLDLHFQEYWVQRAGQDEVKRVRFEGVERAAPAPGVLEALAEADVVLLCPSNPIASIAPILSIPGVRDAVRARRAVVAGVSPIVSGAPLRGMADRLLPPAGVEVTAAGVAEHYAGLLGGWVMDERDASLRARVEALGIRVALVDTIMADDLVAAAVARTAVDLALAGRPAP
jgi:LPPG:FO 2-phospho-L-lactate transferase